MNRYIKSFAIVCAVALLSGCIGRKDQSVAIIGGADGPTAIIVKDEEQSSSQTDKEQETSSVAGESEGGSSQSSTPLLPPKSSSKVTSSSSSQREQKSEEQPVVKFSSENIPIGDLAMITVSGVKDTVKATTDLAVAPVFYSTKDGKHQAVLPVSYKTKPGSYTLTLKAGAWSQSFALVAGEKEFVVQHLTVDPSTTSATIQNDKANQEWNEKIEPLKYISDADKHWSGTFMQPVQGRITTEYASQRYTNGAATPSYHGGIDIAAPADTPVLATGAGRVQFADYIALTGYTIIMEHGYGLKSFYYHMNGVNVKAGDMVEKGQQIGVVGSTGFSTGPHLHFAMAVNTVYTNPWLLFETELG